MTEPEELDEDLFADLYDGDDASAQPELLAKVETPLDTSSYPIEHENETMHDRPMLDIKEEPPSDSPYIEQQEVDQGISGNISEWQNGQTNGDNGHDYGHATSDQISHGTGIKEDGKMFIGGLNWETTDQSLKDYFSTFGEVQECTVMRDGATGRSRGFGFLTFKDAKTVNSVMVKEHYLDGKIIDPKRAIPRDEQERTSKIFVGGVSQEASETDFKEYFMQYGRVVDATLMMDKDTGRPRGFGFVTFDSEAAVDATLQGDLTILGKPIEVKKAQPRGNMRDEEERGGRGGGGGRRGGKDNDRFRDDRNFDNSNNSSNQNQGQQGNQAMYGSGMTPQIMAQYFQKFQLYIASMQQQAAMGGQMGMGGMNPAMMQQMQAMRQMQAMQMAQQQMQGRQQGSQSPHPQSPGSQNIQGMQGMQGMTPAIMQQMQMQAQQAHGSGFNGQVPAAPTGPSAANAGANGNGNNGGATGGNGGRRGTPGYNAQDQLMFEQQKYEHQQRRAVQEQYQQNGITSWEGMYDDVPQPVTGGGQVGIGRGGGHGGFNNRGSNSRGGPNRASQGPQSAPPANAPTGPKNAGVPGANYRGGGRAGGHRGGFHPYARK